MKKYYFTPLAILTFLFASAQTYRITWGEEIKLKKGTADLDIVAADNTGLFFTETRRVMKSYFVIGATYGSSIKLMKLDKNFGEVYDKEYKKELKGLDFHSFQPLENDLYMFASDYDKKSRQFKIMGAKVDKSSGDIPGDFLELGSYELESKRDDYEMKVSPIQNGKAFLMVSNISGKDKVKLGISVLDKNFKKKENTEISLSFNPDYYQLEDVQYTQSNKIVVLGKEYEEAQYGKKKRKRLVFKQYVMGIYNLKGQKENDVTINSDDRYVISGKLVETPAGEMLLAGFYSNAAKKDDLNGFFINKIDPAKGIMTLSSFKEINSGMLGKSFEDETDEDDETKESKKQAKKAKDDDDDEEFPNKFIIRSVDINPADNSIVITSEVSKYSYYVYTNSEYNSTTRTWNRTTTYVHRFTNQDILVINADKDGKIKWLNALPKSQVEEIRTSSNTSGNGIFFGGNDQGNYFARAGGMPYYSSYTSQLLNNNLLLIMNDHTSNNVNPEYGTKVKTVYNFRKRSNVYGITIDLSTGKMTRKIISSNNEETILMPRHAYVVKNEFFIPSWRQRMMAKTQLKFAKISVK
ncbi:MAG TPA: hypothetical protein VFV31_06300 [Chitinophagaceae bacterium]|nr:hypothetical protein [Chitinophagaceae bacterium]